MDRTMEIADLRDTILFGEPYSEEKYEGGIRRFDNLSWKKFDNLIDQGIFALDRDQEDPRPVRKIYDYLQYHHLLRGNGYVCSPDGHGPDGTIVIEGIDYKGIVTMEMLIDFVDMFRDADEFAAGINRLHCFYSSANAASSGVRS